MDGLLTMDRPPHGRIWTLDQDNNFEVDEWTDFWPWTVHLMDGLGRILWLPKWSLCISIFHDSLELKFYSWFWAFERIFQRWNIKWTVLVDHSNSIWGRPLSSERWKVYCWKDLNQLWNFGLFRKMTGSKSEVNWNFPKVFKNVFVSPPKNFLRLKYSRARFKNIQHWSKDFTLISPFTDITDLYQGSKG